MALIGDTLEDEYVHFAGAGTANARMYKIEPLKTELRFVQISCSLPKPSLPKPYRHKVEQYVGGPMAMDHAYIELLYGRVNIGMSKRDYDYFWESPWYAEAS